MSQVKPMGLIESMSGALCGHSDMYFFRKNGKVFTGKRCNPYKGEPTANQTAKRNKFKQAREAVKALTEEQIAEYKTAFKSQKKYVSLAGFIFAKEYEKIV